MTKYIIFVSSLTLRNKMADKQDTERIIRSGFSLLTEKQLYLQADVIRKLHYLGYKVAPSSLNKLINGISMGTKVLRTLGDGIQQLIALELGHSYDSINKEYHFSQNEGWKPTIVPEQREESKEEKIIYHTAGRLSIQDKVAFMNLAQKEIVELGVRLKTFSEYFTSRNELEFKTPLQERLEQGVNIKLYLLDPDSNESRIYFQDREKVQEGEQLSPDITKSVIKQLKKLKEEFKANSYLGQLEVFAYKHIPYNHFLIIDGETKLGRMMVSHYMYGIRRADCPVVEFSKTADRHLFRRYWESYQLYIKDAKKLL